MKIYSATSWGTLIMHRTQLVRNLTCIFLFSASSFQSLYCQSRQGILDLTKKDSVERHSMGVPGQSFSSMGDHKPGLKLPLGLSIQSAEMRPENSMVVHLKILNLGNTIVEVPSCTDQVRAHGNGAKDRRIWDFTVEFFHPQLEQVVSEVAEVTFGSSSVKICVTPLTPGESVLVFFRVQLPVQVSAVLHKPGKLEVKTSITQLSLSDTSFSITSTSAPVQSETAYIQSENSRQEHQ